MENFTANKPAKNHPGMEFPFFCIDATPDKDGDHYVEVENSYSETACCYLKRTDLEALHTWLGKVLAK